jgi:hypothetical protein
MKRFCSIFLFILISMGSGWGQRNSIADSTTVLIGSQAHYGTILPHSKAIADLTDSYLWGWQADISRIRYTQSAWNICNCYSQNGVSLSYFNFNNPKELGRGVSLAVFAEPQLTYGSINLSLRAGAGVSYLTRIYHADNNPRNLFFSSPWSGLLLVQLSSRYQLNQLWSLRLSTSYHHISNGGKRQPNKGMNFPTLSLGVEYGARSKPLRNRARYSMQDKSMHYYAGLSYNSRSADELNVNSQDRRMVIGLHGGFYKPVARMHALGLALEVSHDGALKELARQHDESFDHRVVSGLVRHHFLFGRFDFSQSLGIYLHKEYPNPNTVFQRYAIQYRILENLQIGFSLKAHLHTAEQMDVRLGVVF